MKNKILVFTAAALALSAWSLPAAKNNTGNTEKDGWVTLFDGKTTKGWHAYGKSDGTGRWIVQNGTITIDTTKKGEGGDLTTAEEYDNFDLKLEWKISSKGNSGIIFYVNEDTQKYPDSYNTGPEMQVLDNDGHPDGKIIKHRAGDLYDLISCSKETVKPVGEWNQAEIRSKDGKLELYLNGTNVVTTTMWDDNWKKMVAGSKFKSMPGFGIYKKGKIALQDHGNLVWYRNIKIKKL
ncbi:3-keto-disaccharide hydrolase [Ferruginibacter sp.]